MKVFVFDLDFTLWNTGDTFCSETIPPYRWQNGKLYDDEENWLRLYPDTMDILQRLKASDRIIAIASRSNEPSLAKELLSLFKIDQFFSHSEIFPESKIAHLNHIHQALDIPFHQMVFFDDEQRNINDVQTLGVRSVLVPDGIRLKAVKPYLNN